MPLHGRIKTMMNQDQTSETQTDVPLYASFLAGIMVLGGLALIMLVCVVGFKSATQLPLVFGCALAGIVAYKTGYTWNQILDAMIRGISDALEAVLILLCIGMLIGVWIESGTVPTMISYGLQVVTPEIFLPVVFVVTTLVGIVLGSWGAAGTIGLAFIGMAPALDISLPMTAGAIVGAAYVSEIISPLVDGPNLMAAVSKTNIFSVCVRFLPLVLIVCAVAAVLYFVLGLSFAETASPAAGSSSEASGSTRLLLDALDENFALGSVTLIPLVVMLVCMFVRMPAIPAFLVAIALGMIEAIVFQGSSVGDTFVAAQVGAAPQTNIAELDTLLSTGGLAETMDTISIVILVMAFSGIVQYLHLIDNVIQRLTAHLASFAKLVGATVLSGALFNTLLPDQYPAITLSSQMYGEKFKGYGTKDEVWANIVNSSAGITSVLVPWNTCAVYMVTILGVDCLAYAPYAFFCYLYPLAVFFVGACCSKKLKWRTR
ncbi:sodium:proton antiporter [bacterium D16-34]|nr:sodium:proton antiporter [bacterium D16-34]